jgi:hypothetical protein
MERLHKLEWIALTFAAITLPLPLSAQQHSSGLGDDDIIKTVQRAAPWSIVEKASIIGVDEDGTVRVIRNGSNGFTCTADDPISIGPQAMCADRNAFRWLSAWFSKREPPTDTVGVIYMLSGSTDASTTDPYAVRPDPDGNWTMIGPHLRLVGAKGLSDTYPRGPRSEPRQPFVMWAGTPYEHLVMPVPTPDYRLASALAAALAPRH